MAEVRQPSAAASELVPCPGCAELLSPYVNKCPKCGRHTHQISHDAATQKQARVQQILLMGAAVLAFALILALLWFFTGGADALVGE